METYEECCCEMLAVDKDDDAILSQLVDSFENENSSLTVKTIEEEQVEEPQQSRFKKMQERNLVELAEESIPTNTKSKAMWAFRLYQNWAMWRKSGDFSKDEKSMVS
ncbi:uncharacterized protein LOC116291132 [Actinia tenebrosa]|uniref:Uncharacterized protein LOC116291132 n=1 Tax=Actinia tenebrosa TaxID=6105 RepID=A0A6P8HEG0_ACTTE|nr:uncharacterized protein LOC116291132 [Actinia tenebrosa]